MKNVFCSKVLAMMALAFILVSSANAVEIAKVEATDSNLLFNLDKTPTNSLQLCELPAYRDYDARQGWVHSGFGGVLEDTQDALTISFEAPGTGNPFDPFFTNPHEIRADLAWKFAIRLRMQGVSGGGTVPFRLFAFGDGSLWNTTFDVTADGNWQTIYLDLKDLLGESNWTNKRTLRLDPAEGEVDWTVYENATLEVDWMAVTDQDNFTGTGARGYDVFWELGFPAPIRSGITDATFSIDRFDGQRDRLYRRFQLTDANLNPLGAPQWVTDVESITEGQDFTEQGWAAVGGGCTLEAVSGNLEVTFTPPSGPFDPYILSATDVVETSKVRYLAFRYRMDPVSGMSSIPCAAYSAVYDSGNFGSVSFNITPDGQWHTARVDMASIGAEWSGKRYLRIDFANGETSADPYLGKVLEMDWISMTDQPDYVLEDPRAGQGVGYQSGNRVWDFVHVGRSSHALKTVDGIKGVTVADVQDAIDLDLKSISLTFFLNQICLLPGTNSNVYWEVDGVQVPIHMNYVFWLDNIIKELSDGGMRIQLIPVNNLLTTWDSENPWIHPGTELDEVPTFVMGFNLSDEQGVRWFRAACEFIAHRYTDPRGMYGEIDVMVVGNELQSHWWWHNIGEVSAEEIVEDYTRDMRVADLALRKTHPELRACVSLEHNWNKYHHPDPMRCTTGQIFLSLFADKAKEEGDFPWELAYHPYPSNLLDCRFWNDPDADLSLATQKITMKNIEVLPGILTEDRYLYEGKRRRLYLTEQGCHTFDTPDGQAIQAAALALSYHRISRIPEIDAYNIFSHSDYANDDNLAVGLWTLSPEDEGFYEKKLSWEVWKYIDTDQWQTYADPYLPYSIYSSWDENLPRLTTLDFRFEKGFQAWEPANEIARFYRNTIRNTLEIEAGGGDPFITNDYLNLFPDMIQEVRINMANGGGSQAQLYWKTQAEPIYSGEKSLRFDIIADGQYHLYTLDVGSHSAWQGQTITGLRLDPTEHDETAWASIDFIADPAADVEPLYYPPAGADAGWSLYE